ncbi:hypothetical protein C8R44DRAFT_878776 [Mycena epipterygia]|nr:hypothetical protein C8R44DRAFT_878776 [Mycena epipterygia]
MHLALVQRVSCPHALFARHCASRCPAACHPVPAPLPRALVPRGPRSPAILISAALALAALRSPRFPAPRALRSPAIPISAAPALAGLRPPHFPGAAATGPTLSSVTQFTSPLRFSVQHPPFARYPDFRRPGTCCPAPAPLPRCGCYWTHA